MSTFVHTRQNPLSRIMMLRRYRVVVESPDGSKTRPISFNKWHKERFPGKWPKASIRQDTVTCDQERGDTRSSGWVDYFGQRYLFHFIRIK